MSSCAKSKSVALVCRDDVKMTNTNAKNVTTRVMPKNAMTIASTYRPRRSLKARPNRPKTSIAAMVNAMRVLIECCLWPKRFPLMHADSGSTGITCHIILQRKLRQGYMLGLTEVANVCLSPSEGEDDGVFQVEA
jgi:hypothetical protein